MANITNGTVTVEVTGGVGPYQYTLLNAGNMLPVPSNAYPTFTNPVNNVTSNTFTFGDANDLTGNSGLQAGSYKVKIVDANQCETISNTLVVSNATPSPTATPMPTATEVPPTATPEPTIEPTATEVPPTATPEPTIEPTATATPEPTATEVPPTATPEPTATATPEPTATEVPPTATPEPTLEPTATEVPPTATPEPTATPAPLVLQPQRKVIAGWNLMAGEPDEFINGLLNKTEQEHRDFFCNAPYIGSVAHQSGDEDRPYVLWTDQDDALTMPEVGNVFYADQQGTQYFENSGFLWWNSGTPTSEETNYYWVTIGSDGVAISVEQWTECSIEPTATPEPTATATPEPTATEVPPTATPEPTIEPTATEVPPTATPEPTIEPTATEVPPTATPVPPTATPEPTATEVPPTATPVPPTATPEPTATEVPPTATPVPPTATPEPTATEVPPTATPVPPTATPVPPTATPEPTATEVPPTATPVPPTATPEPTATEVPPTATPVPPTATPVPPTATPEPTATPVPTSVLASQYFVNVEDGSGDSNNSQQCEVVTIPIWSPDFSTLYDAGFGHRLYADENLTVPFDGGAQWYDIGSTPGAVAGLKILVRTGAITETADCPAVVPTATPVPEPTSTPVPEPTSTPRPTDAPAGDAYFFHLGAGNYPYSLDLILTDALYLTNNQVSTSEPPFADVFGEMLTNTEVYNNIGTVDLNGENPSWTYETSETPNYYWLVVPASLEIPNLVLNPKLEIDGAPADVAHSKLDFVYNEVSYTLYRLNAIQDTGSRSVTYVQ